MLSEMSKTSKLTILNLETFPSNWRVLHLLEIENVHEVNFKDKMTGTVRSVRSIK